MKTKIDKIGWIIIGLCIIWLVFCLIVVLTSCQKEPETYCYNCTATDYRGLPINETFCMTDTTEMQTIIDHWEAREGIYHLELTCKLIKP